MKSKFVPTCIFVVEDDPMYQRLYNKDISVLILSSQQDVSTAVKLLREGAADYITKDSETNDRLLHAVNRVKQQNLLQAEVNTLREELEITYKVDKSIIGDSKPMQKVFSLLEKAIKTNITISITGETGTGKEVIAKSIHYNSPRKKEPFVAVNMSATRTRDPSSRGRKVDRF